jgi:hypothetical protein
LALPTTTPETRVGTAHHRTAPSSGKVPSPCHPGLDFFPFGGRCPPYDGWVEAISEAGQGLALPTTTPETRVGTAHHRTAPSSGKVPSPCHPGLDFFPFGGRCPPYDGWVEAISEAGQGLALPTTTPGDKGWHCPPPHRTVERQGPIALPSGIGFFSIWWAVPTLRWLGRSHIGGRARVGTAHHHTRRQGLALPTTAPHRRAARSHRPAIRDWIFFHLVGGAHPIDGLMIISCEAILILLINIKNDFIRYFILCEILFRKIVC